LTTLSARLRSPLDRVTARRAVPLQQMCLLLDQFWLTVTPHSLTQSYSRADQ